MEHNEYQKRVQRARKAFAKVDRLLSEAQDVIGSELSSVEFRAEHLGSHARANDAFNHIEKARRAIQSRY